MTSNPSHHRRIKRLENDTASLYELLDAFKLETRSRFDNIDARLEGHDRRLDSIDTRLDSIDTRLDNVGEGITEILRRLPEAG